MNKFVKFIIYALIFLLVIFLGLVLFTQLVYAQEAECVLVFDDNDEPGFYDEFSFTDSQGREVCKVRVVFHQPAEGDPNGAVFTESGSINGYTADFNGASVHVWRSGSPYSISHSRVWVLESAPPPTEVPPTDVPPSPTPTYIPPVPSDTPGTGTSVPPYPPPPGQNTPTPLPPTLIPPVEVTYTPGAYPPPEEGKQPPAPRLPETGMGGVAESSWPLLFGGVIALILIVAVIRGFKKG